MHISNSHGCCLHALRHSLLGSCSCYEGSSSMCSRSIRSLFLAALLCLALPPSVAAVSVGHVDNFEDGTTQGWTINLLGFGAPAAYPTNVAGGGPSGVDDNYLLFTSLGGNGAGSRLVGINVGAAWTGNYTSAGLTRIRLQARNPGLTDLSALAALEPARRSAHRLGDLRRCAAAAIGWRLDDARVLSCAGGPIRAARQCWSVARQCHRAAPLPLDSRRLSWCTDHSTTRR